MAPRAFLYLGARPPSLNRRAVAQDPATEEVAEWTQAYHHPDPDHKKFGAQVVVRLADGTQIAEHLDNPNAHYLGDRPFARPDYIDKLAVLTEGLVSTSRERALSGTSGPVARSNVRRSGPTQSHSSRGHVGRRQERAAWASCSNPKLFTDVTHRPLRYGMLRFTQHDWFRPSAFLSC